MRRIDARNSTNLGEGWLRGCEQVSRHLAESGVNRTLLLTDGLANIGITDPAELAGSGELPLPPSPMVGRDVDADAVTALLRRQDVRLVMLTEQLVKACHTTMALLANSPTSTGG